jgi:hypothetical protein
LYVGAGALFGASGGIVRFGIAGELGDQVGYQTYLNAIESAYSGICRGLTRRALS